MDGDLVRLMGILATCLDDTDAALRDTTGVAA
jgi:hypothetical protein